jgi:hypothetical protein
MALIGTKEQREEISAGVQAKSKRFCGQKNTNKTTKNKVIELRNLIASNREREDNLGTVVEEEARCKEVAKRA